VRQAQPVSLYISTDGLPLQENNPKCRKFRGSVIDSEA